MDGSGAWWPSFCLLLALVISILASYTMFNFISNLKRTNGTFRQFWLAGGAFVFGIGLWAKHFVTVLAYNQPLYIDWTMLVSLFFIIFFSLTAFVMLTFHGVVRYRLMLGSMILAFGIAIMTYFSVLGQPIERLSTDPAPLTLSLVLLFLGTYGSFLLAEQKKRASLWLASLVLALSVVVVQLLGIHAMNIEFSVFNSSDKLNRDINLLALIIGVAAVLILMCWWRILWTRSPS
jgi:two-component system sporulation sensor kinase A